MERLPPPTAFEKVSKSFSGSTLCAEQTPAALLQKYERDVAGQLLVQRRRGEQVRRGCDLTALPESFHCDRQRPSPVEAARDRALARHSIRQEGVLGGLSQPTCARG